MKFFNKGIFVEFKEFLYGWYKYLFLRFYLSLRHFEKSKSKAAEKLYEGRGRFTRPFIHSGMGGLAVLGLLLAPVIANTLPSGDSFSQAPSSSAVLASFDEIDPQMNTTITDKPRAEIIEYKVENGDTVSGIAKKFGVSVDTIRWANSLESITSIKPGQILKIPPVSGVVHKVKKGDTVYTLAKYYNSDAQGIVDYPFNTFINDETFALAVGQMLIVPDGVMPKVQQWSPSQYIAKQTPNAGTVVASGNFAWPTSGVISQGFKWYHKAIDIANKTGTPILAADAGKVIIAGWPDNSGYGNRVFIDHGNGFLTVYAHLSQIHVSAGQTVKRGDSLGLMGSTGRSTGPHLHFEIRVNGSGQDPMGYLK
jgi:murein DD-endopeptidase MepM/ murein hydrolase activator NlpD